MLYSIAIVFQFFRKFVQMILFLGITEPLCCHFDMDTFCRVCSSCEQCPHSTTVSLTFGFVWQSYISVTIWLSNKEYLELLLLSTSSSQQCNGNAMVNLTQTGKAFISSPAALSKSKLVEMDLDLIGRRRIVWAAADWNSLACSSPAWESRHKIEKRKGLGLSKLTEG